MTDELFREGATLALCDARVEGARGCRQEHATPGGAA